ncbi:dihydrofolate reductase [Moesziomyces antarcticus T-34]|uniref:Dihydrofolate reductase n=1 Tax=Pseudozyma antarctica (strain T-34) TaxID=1151754 RepID=M9LR02_PSEA3|nr:dihydrofolate reductase [Moesziomyces antarcticus T-34]
MAKLKLAMVAAMSLTNGIGKDGGLPWRLKGEMAYFRNLTTHVSDEDKQRGVRNAVIMGRKTWASIPPKFRPLSGRINIVISRTQSAQDLGVDPASKDVRVFASVQDALQFLAGPLSGDAVVIGRVFVIGGAQLYAEMLDLDTSIATVDKLLVTRILAPQYDCDAHFAEFRTREQLDADADLAKKVAPAEVDAQVETVLEQHLPQLLEQSRWTQASPQALRDYLGTSVPAALANSPDMVSREDDTWYQYQLWMRQD